MKCDYCTEKCPQAETIREISKGRMYATNEVVKLQKQLEEYINLEEQGLLLRLPCKVGDTVYTACSWGIEIGVVGSIEIISDRIFVNNIHGEMIGEAHNIFLTQAEAEQKLKEMED